MTSGQILTAVVFLGVGAAAGVYGVALVSEPAAWIAGGTICGAVGAAPFLRRAR